MLDFSNKCRKKRKKFIRRDTRHPLASSKIKPLTQVLYSYEFHVKQVENLLLPLSPKKRSLQQCNQIYH